MKGFQYKMAKVTALVLMCLFLSAGKGCDKKIETLVLEPDSKRFYYTLKGHGDAGGSPDSPIGIPCPAACFYTMGQSCDRNLSADNSTVVGYSHNYDAGTEPCRCWEYVDCAYRGYVGFNIAPLQNKGIVGAKLLWQESTQISAGSNATNAGSCVRSIYYATEPWQMNSLTAGEHLGDISTTTTSGSYPVETIIRKWKDGSLPNNGFFFVGPNENTNVKNNDRCFTTMTDLRLEVIVSE